MDQQMMQMDQQAQATAQQEADQKGAVDKTANLIGAGPPKPDPRKIAASGVTLEDIAAEVAGMVGD